MKINIKAKENTKLHITQGNLVRLWDIWACGGFHREDRHHPHAGCPN